MKREETTSETEEEIRPDSLVADMDGCGMLLRDSRLPTDQATSYRATGARMAHGTVRQL